LLVGIVLALSAAFVAGPAQGRNPGRPLERVRDIRLPGRSSRFDYQSIDAAGRRLYVAHLGDSTLDVIDLDTLAVTATVPDLRGVHGVLAAPEIGRVFVSATGTDELVTVDASSDQVIARTPTGEFPDGIAYSPHDDLVLVSNKDAGSETIIEGRSGQVVRTVHLGREVGNVAYDSSGALAYVAVVHPTKSSPSMPPAARSLTGFA
jgi:YVTN family beta-propeller protein